MVSFVRWPDTVNSPRVCKIHMSLVVPVFGDISPPPPAAAEDDSSTSYPEPEDSNSTHPQESAQDYEGSSSSSDPEYLNEDISEYEKIKSVGEC